jgi:plasmid replication initiation protein
MTQNECKVVSFLISKIRKDDNTFNIQTITVKDFNELLDIKGSKSYTYMKNFEEELLKRKVRVIFNNGDRLNVNWFQYSKYINENATLELCFNSYLKEHLLELNKNYTKYVLQNICKLNSVHAIKLYELLKQYYKIGSRIIDINDLKYMLGIAKGYSQYCDFKKRVLLVSVSEINKNTDLEIEFKEMKIGRKVSEIKFSIETNKKCKFEKTPELDSKDIATKINSIQSDIKAVIGDLIDNAKILVWIEQEKEKTIYYYLENWHLWRYKNKKSNAGFFIDLVDNKRTIPAGEKGLNFEKPIQSTNFEQRVYDDEYFESLYENFRDK